MRVTLSAMSAMNWTLFVVGMTIVWLVAHSGAALLGAFVASIHLSVKQKR